MISDSTEGPGHVSNPWIKNSVLQETNSYGIKETV